MKNCLPAVLAAALSAGLSAAEGLLPDLTASQAAEAARLIQGFKENRRGPFFRIRWFCNDGTDHPPFPYPCGDRGGGAQHASLSPEALRLALWNVDVGTILAGQSFERLFDAERDHYRLKEIVLEEYLEQVDDGWIYRRAYSYRGAWQAEDEEKAGRKFLIQLLSDPEWTGRRFFLVNQLIATLPHGQPDATVRRVRNLATTIAAADERFQPIRAKIHSAPDERDVESVKNFLEQNDPPGPLRRELEELAALLARQQEDRLQAELPRLLAEWAGDALAPRLEALANALKAENAEEAYRRGAELSAAIAEQVQHSSDGRRNLALLDANLLLQEFAFRAAPPPGGTTRARLLETTSTDARYAYGAGLLSRVELAALDEELLRFGGKTELSASGYFEAVRYLSRAPEWARATAVREFGGVANRYAAFEPKAAALVDHLLRGSAALPLSRRLEALLDDAGRQVGVRHEIFGRGASAGVFGLNPGVARGELDTLRPGRTESVDPTKIYVIPETAADLKPVAGVLTLDSGNALSHTQLLAANLGIPNATVPSSLLPLLEQRIGQEIIFEVSPRGEVQLKEAGQGETAAAPVLPERIELDSSRLDLGVRELLPLDELDAADAGVIVGPKAANVGQLAKLFPDFVAPAMAIPFGVYWAHIDRPIGSAGSTLAARIDEALDRAEQMRTEGVPEATIQQYIYPKLAEFRRAIETMTLLPWFEERLRSALRQSFGPDGTYGVFVRSDTNAEDLPQFTGAGLNRTAPNVVELEEIERAIKQVWASPFSERAYDWRSRALRGTDQVYPSILLMRTVCAEKSGVIATVNLETGAREEITVNASEGVSAVVDGGVAESLLLQPDGAVKLLQQARATYRRACNPAGGFIIAPPQNQQRLLTSHEVAQVRRLVDEVERRYPPALDPDGTPLPWDIEFGVEAGRIWLFQIRPLVRWRPPQAVEGDRLVRLDELPL